MEYIWKNYNGDNTFIVARGSNNFSPFIESYPMGNGYVGLNYLLRFADIFQEVDNFIVKDTIYSNYQKDLENVVNMMAHILVDLDRKKGIHKFTIENSMLEQELQNGDYGKEISNAYMVLSADEKWNIVNLLRKQKNCDGKELYFNRAVKYLFNYSKVYFDEFGNKLLVFLGDNDTDKNKIKIQLAIDLFLEIGTNLEIFWSTHFGIIDRDETMIIDEIAIY